MFTLFCPSCGSARHVEVTSAMPLRAWLHCGSCNHLWKTSGVRLLCSWLAGGSFSTPGASIDAPENVHEPTRTSAKTDPAIEQWLAQGTDGETRRSTNVSVSAWLETDPLEQPARVIEQPLHLIEQLARVIEQPAPTIEIDDEYFLPPAPTTSPSATLGERLDTFYDGLVRLEEFVKRCARQEEVAAAKAAAGHAIAGPVRRASVVPFHRAS